MPQRFRRLWTDAEFLSLILTLVAGMLVYWFFGRVLAPFVAAIVLAYLLEGPVQRLQQRGLGRTAAVACVFVPFLVLVVLAQVALIPALFRQIGEFKDNLPGMLRGLQEAGERLSQSFPSLFPENSLEQVLTTFRGEIVGLGQKALSSGVQSIVAWVVNLVLIPFLVFFFLKDKRIILEGLRQSFPFPRRLLDAVWEDFDHQIGGFLRAKFLEVLIVWGVSAVTFAALGLNFSFLMGFLVGASQLIPYVGIVAVTVPLGLVAYFQWGLEPEFFGVMLAFGVIQILEGNVMMPWLLSEMMRLHPIVIIVAILIFGHFLGVWGIFFAVPLATLVRSIYRAIAGFWEAET